MEGGDQWRVIRYDGGDAIAMHGNNKLPMLRFRPIAPKPVSAEGDSLVNNNNNLLLNFKRTKRKYVRVRKNNNGYRRKKKTSSTSTTTTTTTTTKNDLADGQIISTLQLLPEKKDLELSPAIIMSSNLELDLTVSVDQTVTVTTDLGSETNMVYVTVESVTLTDTCIMEKRVNNLVSDTCPGFVSDGENRVYWVNNAFKSLINNDKEMIIVLLVMKDGLRSITSMKRDFTCKVKVEYTWQKEKCLKMVVPCDVWRLDDRGAFAWRLDIDAALSLGPLKCTVGGD